MNLLLVWALTVALSQTQNLNVDGDAVRVVRDAFGVPHVFASTLKGLFHGAGYAVGQDRLWQMERNRRAALGELAEIYGSGALDQDKSARLSGYTEAERAAQIARLSPELQTALQAYCDGVNARIASEPLPPEFTQFGVAPRLWMPTDCAAIAQLMSRRFGAFGEGEVRNMALYTLIEPRLKDKVFGVLNDAAWVDDPQSPVSVPRSEEGPNAPKPAQPVPASLTKAHLALLPKFGIFDLLSAVGLMACAPELEFAERHGLYTHFGSYAVAVSGKHTPSGFGLLLGGPQMGWATPQIAHEIQLSGAGIEVSGMGFPGIPGVLIGFTPNIAWTTTSGLGDEADVFCETVDPADPGRYLFKGKSVPFEERKETVLVKGKDPVVLDVRRSVHGPVIKAAGKWAFARGMTYWNRELENFDAFFDFYKAKTLGEFGAAARRVVTSHNFLATTKDGQIGYWFTGLYPIRSPKLDPRFPTPGTGEYEWRGMLPVSKLPMCVNPKQGWLGNWNNKPAAWWPNSDTPVWGANQRFRLVQEFLDKHLLVSPDDLRSLIREIGTKQLDAEMFVPLLEAAANGRSEVGSRKSGPETRHPTPDTPLHDAGTLRALRLLTAWDFHERDDSAANALFSALMRDLREDLFKKVFGDLGSPSNFQQVTQASYLWHVLGDSPLKPHYDYLGGRSAGQALLSSFTRAVAELTKQYGNAANAPFRASRMHLTPLPDVPYSNRGTFIQIVEMGRPFARGWSVLCPGESEDAKSPHYSDQRDLSLSWTFKPMLWRAEELKP